MAEQPGVAAAGAAPIENNNNWQSILKRAVHDNLYVYVGTKKPDQQDDPEAHAQWMSSLTSCCLPKGRNGSKKKNRRRRSRSRGSKGNITIVFEQPQPQAFLEAGSLDTPRRAPPVPGSAGMQYTPVRPARPVSPTAVSPTSLASSVAPPPPPPKDTAPQPQVHAHSPRGRSPPRSRSASRSRSPPRLRSRKRSAGAKSVKKMVISAPTDFRHVNAAPIFDPMEPTASLVRHRSAFEPFEPLELSIYLPRNRLEPLPDFEGPWREQLAQLLRPQPAMIRLEPQPASPGFGVSRKPVPALSANFHPESSEMGDVVRSYSTRTNDTAHTSSTYSPSDFPVPPLRNSIPSIVVVDRPMAPRQQLPPPPPVPKLKQPPPRPRRPSKSLDFFDSPRRSISAPSRMSGVQLAPTTYVPSQAPRYPRYYARRPSLKDNVASLLSPRKRSISEPARGRRQSRMEAEIDAAINELNVIVDERRASNMRKSQLAMKRRSRSVDVSAQGLPIVLDIDYENDDRGRSARRTLMHERSHSADSNASSDTYLPSTENPSGPVMTFEEGDGYSFGEYTGELLPATTFVPIGKANAIKEDEDEFDDADTIETTDSGVFGARTPPAIAPSMKVDASESILADIGSALARKGSLRTDTTGSDGSGLSPAFLNPASIPAVPPMPVDKLQKIGQRGRGLSTSPSERTRHVSEVSVSSWGTASSRNSQDGGDRTLGSPVGSPGSQALPSPSFNFTRNYSSIGSRLGSWIRKQQVSVTDVPALPGNFLKPVPQQAWRRSSHLKSQTWVPPSPTASGGESMDGDEEDLDDVEHPYKFPGFVFMNKTRSVLLSPASQKSPTAVSPVTPNRMSTMQFPNQQAPIVTMTFEDPDPTPSTPRARNAPGRPGLHKRNSSETIVDSESGGTTLSEVEIALGSPRSTIIGSPTSMTMSLPTNLTEASTPEEAEEYDRDYITYKRELDQEQHIQLPIQQPEQPAQPRAVEALKQAAGIPVRRPTLPPLGLPQNPRKTSTPLRGSPVKPISNMNSLTQGIKNLTTIQLAVAPETVREIMSSHPLSPVSPLNVLDEKGHLPPILEQPSPPVSDISDTEPSWEPMPQAYVAPRPGLQRRPPHGASMGLAAATLQRNASRGASPPPPVPMKSPRRQSGIMQQAALLSPTPSQVGVAF